MTDPRNDWAFLTQILGDAKRTLLVPARLESAARVAADEFELTGLFRVRICSELPVGHVLVVDEVALEADLRQAAQRASQVRAPRDPNAGEGAWRRLRMREIAEDMMREEWARRAPSAGVIVTGM